MIKHGTKVLAIRKYDFNGNNFSTPERCEVMGPVLGWSLYPHFKVRNLENGKTFNVPEYRCFVSDEECLKFLQEHLKAQQKSCEYLRVRYEASRKKAENYENMIKSLQK